VVRSASPILLACIVGALGAGCTFYGAYGVPRAELENIEQLHDRIRVRDAESPFVVGCVDALSDFGCSGLVGAVGRALMAARMIPSAHGSSAPGVFALDLRGHAGGPTGWIMVTVLTAGLIPAPMSGARIEIRGAVVAPCGERLAVVVEDPLRAWISGPFLPSAWLGGRGTRTGAIYEAPVGFMGMHALEEAYANLARRAVVELFDKLDSAPRCTPEASIDRAPGE
jgi:hypothetical protein